MNALHFTSSRLQAALVALALLVVSTWALPAAAASPEKLIEQASTWYAAQCSDPSKELFASDRSNQLLADLQAGNEESGEPALLAWHGLISVCTGDREGGQANIDLFKTLAADVEPALSARVEMELALRDRQCRTAANAAGRLAKAGKTTDDARAVLLARTHCKTKCTVVASSAQRLKEMGGDLTPFATRVDACRAEIAENKRKAEERAAEQKRIDEETKRLAEEQAAQQKKQSEERAARRAAITPEFTEVSAKYALARKKAAPAKALSVIGLAGGGTLAALGLISKVQGEGYASAAADAFTGDEYQEQVDLIEPTNTRMGVFLGSGSALLASGIVGAVISGLQAKKSKAVRDRHDALRRELDELDAQEGK